MIKKKEFNGQLKHILKEEILKNDNLQSKKITKVNIPNKLKVNLSSSLKYITKKKNSKKVKKYQNNNLYYIIILNNLQKHNSNAQIKNVMIVNNLINCKSCHFLAIFKEYLITDYVEEFLRRIYYLKESVQRMPKLHSYYKNYLNFFCKPTFTDSFANEIIKNYGDLNAECFYKNNLEKKRNQHETKRILDKNIKKDNDKNSKDKNGELIKTVFTKSIKNSIDNIKFEDSINNTKNSKTNNDIIISDFSNKIQQDSIINIGGNENGNLISEGNSLLLIINEIKDYKNKQKITEKAIKNLPLSEKKINNNKDNNKFTSIKLSYKDLNINKTILSNNNNREIKDNNKEINKSNLTKTSTFTNVKHLDSIEKMIYSPKSKKNAKFYIKKEKGKIEKNKNERYLSPKSETINLNNLNNTNNNTNIANNTNVNTNNNTITNNKNHNSIVVNINININTNQNTINNNTYKSPIHNINKKKFPLSPLSPISFNMDKEFSKKSIPLNSARNKDIVKSSNYVKIMKRKNDYNNLVLSTKRNKKLNDIKRIKALNSIDINEYANKQNYTCNKDTLHLNKQNSPKKNHFQKIEYSINKGNNELNCKYNTINKNVYFSPKIGGDKSKYNKSMKNIESVNEINKKYIYRKKQNFINSPLNKNYKFDSKYFTHKKLENINNNLNLV